MFRSNWLTGFRLLSCFALSLLALPYQATASKNSLNSPFGSLPAAVIPPQSLNLKNPFDAALELGMKWDRSQIFIWQLIQPDLKRDDFFWPDARFFRDVPPDFHLVANIMIGSPDPAIAGDDASGYNRYAFEGSFMPRDQKAYVRFVKALVERYDGDGKNDAPGLKSPIKYWQVDNEPPHGLRDYAKFLSLTSQAVKEADPEAKVLIGGVPGMPPVRSYLSAFDSFYLPILKEISTSGRKCFDIFDYHWYGGATGDYRGLEPVHAHITKALKKLNISCDEIWITEMGTYSGAPEPIEQIGTLRDFPFQSEELQAADLIKRYALALSLGVRKIFTCGILEGFKHDRGYFDFTGLIYDGRFANDPGRGVKKKAFYAYQTMTRILQGCDWKRTERVKQRKGLFHFIFNKEGKKIHLVWTEKLCRANEKPGSQLTDSEIFTLDQVKTDRVRIVRPLRDRKDEDLKVRRGKVQVRVNGYPVFIVEE